MVETSANRKPNIYSKWDNGMHYILNEINKIKDSFLMKYTKEKQ